MEPNENQNQNQQTNSTNSQNLNGEVQSTETQPNGNTPTAPVTPQTPPVPNELDSARQSNSEVLEIYNQVLREQQAELARLRVEAQERNRPAPLSADEQKQKFFSNPMDVLREEISNAVKPLMEFTQSFKQQSEYDKLKDKYRNDPRYKEMFPYIENYVDQILSNSEKNEQTLRTAVLVAIGAAQTGEIKLPNQQQNRQSTPTPQPNTPQNNMTVPAHLRSTPPTPPSNNNSPQAPSLTELEKRLARELNMTPEQYVRYREMPSHEVATAEVK